MRNITFVYFVGPKILYEQEHNAEQLLVKNFSVKVRPNIVTMTTLGTLIRSSSRPHHWTTSIWELIFQRLVLFICPCCMFDSKVAVSLANTIPLLTLLFQYYQASVQDKHYLQDFFHVTWRENICTVHEMMNAVILLLMLLSFSHYSYLFRRLQNAFCALGAHHLLLANYCRGCNRYTWMLSTAKNWSLSLFLMLCLSSDWTLQYRFSSPQHLQSAAMADVCDAGGTQQRYDNTIG